MIHAEVALYPLKTSDASEVINNSINALRDQGVQFSVGSMDTHIHGTEEQVWGSLRSLFQTAQNSGEVSMVVTITNAADH